MTVIRVLNVVLVNRYIRMDRIFLLSGQSVFHWPELTHHDVETLCGFRQNQYSHRSIHNLHSL